MKSAMQEDAKRLVDRLQNTYKHNDEISAIGQVTEIFDYLVTENQHECLGVTPDAVKDIFDLLKVKI